MCSRDANQPPYQLCHYEVNDLACNNGQSRIESLIILRHLLRRMYRSCRSISPGPEVAVAIQGSPPSSTPSPTRCAAFQSVINFKLLDRRQWTLLRNRRVVDYLV